jgi:Secretion system C-terminal sorting domain
MKKFLLSIFILSSFLNMKAQNIYNFNFNGNTTGWSKINQSTSSAPTGVWKIPTYTVVTVGAPAPLANPFGATVIPVGQVSPIPEGQSGGPNSFAIVGKTSTTSTATIGATISNWLISPSINVQDGNVISFYTRCGTASSLTSAPKADRLELRMSTQGASSNDPQLGPTDFGDYTLVLTTVNPNQTLTGYPTTWTRYSYTVTGLSSPTECKFAFRYNVINGGINGQRSDIIGIDTFSVDTDNLSTTENFSQNFVLFPNPVSNSFSVSTTNGSSINQIQITDINGRVVNNTIVDGLKSTEINSSDLTTGIYFVKVSSDIGSATTKLLKQ